MSESRKRVEIHRDVVYDVYRVRNHIDERTSRVCGETKLYRDKYKFCKLKARQRMHCQ